VIAAEETFDEFLDAEEERDVKAIDRRPTARRAVADLVDVTAAATGD
jgi:hypothetical protein